ncbi:MAG: sugar ABC transporter ATP-binding protein, partial [Lachnospiraceae bacterium]|nr:sugar ABC transporter ATP-binding protein [Lachnospiraceae bacterium]
VHVLMGENGAGKSTLMKILAGIYQADEGEITLHGKKVEFHTPRQALDNGIAMIHQELSPVLDMTIAENLFLGKEYITAGFIDYKKMNSEAKKLLNSVGIDLNPTLQMKKLSVSQMQMVEIAKALSFNSEIIIMDEPSASITDREIDNLFRIIRRLKEEGRCIVYITHKMNEVFKIADEITIFRDGEYIGTYDADSITENQLVTKMVDRELTEIYPQRHNVPGEVVMEVKGFSQTGVFENISFELHKGEILGFAGLMGSGRTEVMNAVFGITKSSSGEVLIKGEPLVKPMPSKAMEKGIGYVTEDRKGNGLILGMSVCDNIILPSLNKLSNWLGVVNRKKSISLSEEYKDKLRIKTPSIQHLVKQLSGGNQQKIVLTKWLLQNPDILIFDEPTRGIDVGAKTEIYRLIAQLAEEGKAIIFISSEMPEILGMSDRIVIFYEGRKTGELDQSEATQEKILTYASGLN